MSQATTPEEFSVLLGIRQAHDRREWGDIITQCDEYMASYPQSPFVPRVRFYQADAYCQSAFDSGGNLISSGLLLQGQDILREIIVHSGQQEPEVTRLAEGYEECLDRILENHSFFLAQGSTDAAVKREQYESQISVFNRTALLWRLELAARQEDHKEMQAITKSYLDIVDVDPLTYESLMAALVRTCYPLPEKGEISLPADDLLNDPRGYYAHVILASRLLETGRPAEAIIELEKARQQVQEIGEKIKMNVKEKATGLPPLIGFKELAERDEPRIAASLVGLYKSLARSQPELAGQFYRKAWTINPKDLEALLCAARLHFLNKNWKRAVQCYQLLFKEVQETGNREYAAGFVSYGDGAALLLSYLNAGITTGLENPGLGTTIAEEARGSPDADLCELVLKVHAAEKQNLPLKSGKERKQYFSFDPLSLHPVSDTPYDWLCQRIRERVGKGA